MPTLVASDWYVTAEKVQELVRRIVERVDPLEIIAFGSRARGDHREDSDLDVAVIVVDEQEGRQKLRNVRADLWISADLLVVGKERYDRFRPWINTLEREIDRQGVRLYERGGKSVTGKAFEGLCARRAHPALRTG